MLIIIIVGLIMNSSAQIDRFFSCYRESYEDDEWCEFILLPPEHGLDYDYIVDNVPLGSGLLIMAGMSLFYATGKKKK